jgi:hypothetical protein
MAAPCKKLVGGQVRFRAQHNADINPSVIWDDALIAL